MNSRPCIVPSGTHINDVSASLLPWDEGRSPAHNGDDEVEGPLDCRYEHIGRRPSTSPGSNNSAAPAKPDIASQCPDKTRLTAPLAYLANHITHDDAFLQANVVLVLTDSNPLTDYPHWHHTGRIIRERLKMVAAERWTAVYVPLTEATGMHKVHYTWGATFVIEALFASDPTKN